MSKVNPTYQGSDFKEWFKTMYGRDYSEGESLSKNGAKTGAMSDVDWDIGQALYNNYTSNSRVNSKYDSSKKTLEDAYNTAIAGAKENKNAGISSLERHYGTVSVELERDRAAATQQADRTYELMKKYLPEQLKENGLAGSGFSESTMLGAYATHANSLGQIESDFAANKTALANEKADRVSELERAYGDDVRSATSEKNAKLSELELAYGDSMAESEASARNDVNAVIKRHNDKAESEALAEKDRTLEEFELNYDAFMELGEYERAKELVEAHKDILGSSYDSYMLTLDIYKENKAAQIKKENEEKTKAEEQAVINGEKTINYNEKKYKVKAKIGSDLSWLLDDKDFKTELSKRGYSDAKDKHIPNGTVISFKAGLLTTKALVNYNGEWYLLENA